MKNSEIKTQPNENPSEETVQSFTFRNVVDDGVFLYYQQKHRKFLYNDIMWIEASGSYCNIRMSNHKQIVFVYTLYQLYEKLPKNQFVRIHRSYIVNIYAVTAFLHKLIYVGDQMLPISSPYLNDVMSHFNWVDNRKVLAKQKEQINKQKEESE